MSNPISISVASAVAFNSRQARRLGWYDAIPADAVAVFPGLAGDALGIWVDKVAFAGAVVELQALLGIDEDGKLGRGTWSALLKRFEFIGPLQAYAVVRGRRIVSGSPPPASLEFKNFDAGGLDLHPGGRFYNWHARTNKRKRIALHWGGHDCRNCRNALMNGGNSSQYGVDPSTVEQWLDLAHTGYHAGYANVDSIGIDICQQPTTKFLGKYQARGYDVRVVDSPAIDPSGRVRGDRRILTLDPRTVKNVQALLRFLCDLADIPYRVPRGHNGKQTTGKLWHGVFSREELYEYEGIFCHAHVSPGKWDVSPWMAQLFSEDLQSS